MPRYRVEMSPEAAAHVVAIHDWWGANRPAAPRLFAQELRAAVRQLRRAPHSGRPYAPDGVRPTRRLVMPRTRYLVYYVTDDAPRLVRIYAVWHAAQGLRPGGPP